MSACIIGASAASFGRAANADHTLNRRQIAAALLTLSDVPAGYAKTKLSGSSSSAPTNCPEAKDPFKNATTAKGEVDFSRGLLGPFLIEGVAQLRSGLAAKGMDKFRRLLKTCATFKEKGSDGSTATGHFAPESFPRLADDTIAVKVRVESRGGPGPDLTLSGDLAAIRSHDAVVLVAQFGLIASPSVRAFVKTVKRAVSKIQHAQR